MVTRKNAKNRTAYVGHVTPSGLGFSYSVPLKGVKIAQRLTIRQNGEQVELTGSQLRSLMRVVKTARRLANS